MKILRRIPPVLLPLMALEAGLKLVALWQAVRARQYKWSVALILVNSAGVLPLLYLLRFQPKAPAR